MLDTIARSTRKPGVYLGYDTRLAVNNLPATLVKMLIVAQRTAAGSVAQLVPKQVFSDADAAEFFGTGSPAHLMTRAALTANRLIDLTVITLDDDGAGVKAAGTCTVTGPATGAGVLTLKVANRTVQIAVAADDTANEIAAALKAECDLHPDLPVVASVNNAVVTLTALNKGLYGNGVKLSASTTAAGTTTAIVAMANGATEPDIADALAIVYPVRYHVVASQFNDATSLAALRDHLDEVSGKIEQRSAQGYYGFTGSLGDATTLAAGTNAARLAVFYARGSISHPADIAAAYAAHRGGVLAVDPALPLDNDLILGIAAPSGTDRLSRTEQESCLHNGVTPADVNKAGQAIVVRAVTNYLVNEADAPDEALLDDTTISTLDYTREYCKSLVQLRFPKAKASRKLPPRIRTVLLDALKKLETAEILMDIDLHKAELVVERNDADPAGWLRATIPAPVVPGLHVFDGTIVLYL